MTDALQRPFGCDILGTEECPTGENDLAYRIYAADDDPNIRGLLLRFLESEGYRVTIFENGDLLYDAFEKEAPDLILLDVMMPGTDGMTICARIRRVSKVPIIILTAKDSDADQVVGISMGSDDYLTKPFRPTLLMLRVKAILRRVEMERAGRDETPACGDLTYLPEQREIRAGGKPVALTMTEFSLLAYMMKKPGCAVSREELLDAVWGFKEDVETRVTDETVRRVRKKLQLAGSKAQLSTIWGFGYKLTTGGGRP
ncbi:MAG: response regulator transcription factor [Christensenellaceae bacterium]|nr:response regulator transcription factor [Christensenellaceae bacterium]